MVHQDVSDLKRSENEAASLQLGLAVQVIEKQAKNRNETGSNLSSERSKNEGALLDLRLIVRSTKKLYAESRGTR